LKHESVRNPSAGGLIAICNDVTGREMSIVFGHSRNFDVKANVLDISLLRCLIGFRPAAPESIMWDKLSVGVAAPPQT